MKPPQFEYVRARSLLEAADHLSASEDAKILAGGQSLVPMLSMRLARPEVLVDIGQVATADYIDVSESTVEIGATTRQATVEADPQIARTIPLLSSAISFIGHPQIRHRGTVCGSLVHHDPSAELPTAALALDAEFLAIGAESTRTIAAADFFTATFDTALEENELLSAVRFQTPPIGSGWSFREIARRSGDFALGGVAVVLHRDEAQAIDHARLVLLGVGATPVRLTAVEELLLGATLDDDLLTAVGALVRDSINPGDDVHASGEYRRELSAVLTTQAVTESWERCR